jgi:hypothetical protein
MDSTKLQTVEARLIEQGAHQGTIDAYGAEVRKAEAAAIARSLRAVAGNGDYSLGGIDPEIMERVAREIEQYAS